ncbi:MAG: hypothetical protein ED559_04105 [Phycisphaera sp.]|nr:MAG: hypothetical protein ED559_04105 [Phycisphaera sp.]
MTRVLAILILVATGLPRLGVGLAGGQDHCGEFACHQPVVQVDCCGSEMVEEAYCPMSNGSCECIAAPASDPEPKPEAPLLRSDRDTITGMPNGPPQVMPVAEPDTATPKVASLVLALTAGKSHNEIQALLGIWQT